MSELISGKEALIALANGEEVQYIASGMAGAKYWSDSEKTKSFTIHDFYSGSWVFRLKPRTITINGIEVPSSFEPKEGDWFYFIAADSECGYSSRKLHDDTHEYLTQLGAWRTKDEIMQVVAALRSIFSKK